MTTCDLLLLVGAVNIYVALCVCIVTATYMYMLHGEGKSWGIRFTCRYLCIINVSYTCRRPPQRPPHSPPTGHLAVHLKMLCMQQ